ncbi:ATP-binding protein [Methanolobus sp. WCC1]|uniref:AAA family ATPase n=1 Tax=unclassified Methanolobus TaxID=2629569 RepID=UPI00324A23BB
MENDQDGFRTVANEIIREEQKKKHHLLAKDLKKILETENQKDLLNSTTLSSRYKNNIQIPRDSEKGFPLLEIKESYLNLGDVIVDSELHHRISKLVDEMNSRDVFATYGLKPKQKVLFCGPPGTGKTLTAHILSSLLGYPLVHVNFDSIVSSFLGETATNLRKVFDFIEHGEWVVLFDEFDVIGKKRDDPHEHGEIKRVVNNFMQMMDGFNGKSLLIAATNHEYLLDSAMWRRFDDILLFPLPNSSLREEIFKRYLSVAHKNKDLDFKYLVDNSEGFSPADIAQVCEEAIRTIILEDKKEVNFEIMKSALDYQNQKKSIISKDNELWSQNMNI